MSEWSSCFFWSPEYMCGCARGCEEEVMENLVVGIVALALFVYLLVAMIRPEKF